MRHHFISTEELLRLDLDALVEDHDGRNLISEEEVLVWFEQRYPYRMQRTDRRRQNDQNGQSQ